MSSILKALEKVEESQSTRRSAGVGGLVKHRDRRPAWLLPAGVVGGAVVAALVTFAAMGGFSRSAAPVAKADMEANSAPVVAAPPQAATQSPVQPAQVVPAAPAGAVSVSNPVTPPSPAKMQSVRPAEKPDRSVATAAAAPPATSARPSPVQATASEEPAPFQVAPEHLQPVPAETAAPASHEKPRPGIRVTGIAWQKDSASSAAIINGRSLQQGGVVEGYKVEKILEDRVILSSSSGKMEVPLGAGE